MQPLVSIVMPVRNAMPYLRACLDSILAQSYGEWELLAVNDGSSDDSKRLLLDYAGNDQRIQTFDNDGQGIISALQLAYQHTAGQYITRMDADDIMMVNKLKVLVSNISSKPQSIAIGQVEYFSEGAVGDGYRKYQNWLNHLTSVGNNFRDIYKECAIPSPCWMMHRVDFDAINGFESDVYPEDYDLAFRMYQAGLQVVPCHQVIHRWRDYANRTSRTDDNYADNRFLDIKVHYFIEIDYNRNHELILWGAGKKGKQIAQLLINEGISFTWVCDNPNKIGHDIYGVILEAPAKVIEHSQIILAVAGEAGRILEEQLVDRSVYAFC